MEGRGDFYILGGSVSEPSWEDQKKAERKLEAAKSFGFGSSICMFVIMCVCLGMWGCPKYQVYKRTLIGEAELRQAEWNRQIQIQEADAKKEAATSLAVAEVERAKGVAEANKIIGESLRKNEAYLRYLWINELSENGQNVIYIPTETGMPILEAGKR